LILPDVAEFLSEDGEKLRRDRDTHIPVCIDRFSVQKFGSQVETKLDQNRKKTDED